MTALMLFGATSAIAQSVVTGKVVDENNTPLVGAAIVVPGTSDGTNSNTDGTFTLKTSSNAHSVEISFVGYQALVKEFKGQGNIKLGIINMQPDAIAMQDVIISQSMAVQRKTPVAVSSVSAADIDYKLGTQEFPEILKSTPGTYATKSGGGYGDSQIRLRGFSTENIAIMVNGVPMNDMEGGKVYWSNWAGLSDVTRSMQVQRGLGASKISAPSVGGSINIVTNTIDAQRGGTASIGMGNDGLYNVSFSVSSGLTKSGWAMTVMGAKRWANGYVQGTDYTAYNWFVNISKRINDRHQLSLTAFGSPQEHYQRSNMDGLTIAGWQQVNNYMKGKSPYRYNPTYGFGKNGERKSSSYNEYHKPQISLNHQWQIDHKSSLSTAVYMSIGRGSGYRGEGLTSTLANQWYGSNNGVLNTTFRNADGTFAYDQIQELNEQSDHGSEMVLAKNKNNHEWYGLLSTYTNQLTKSLELTAGVDVRYYVGHHTAELCDLFNGAYYTDVRYRSQVSPENNAAAADPNWQYEKLGIGDVIYRDYDGHVHQEGVFAQLEWSKDKVNAFISGSISNAGYWRYDRFYYDADHARSETVNFLGGTIKGGVNFNIDRYNNVFANIGYISRAPFFSGGAFLNSTISNATNPDAVNEKIFSAEIGYGFKSPKFALNLNAYYTMWMDKTMTASGKDYQYELDGVTVTDRPKINLQGVDARHMGIELDFVAKPAKWLDINGMLSWGDWQWNSNATGFWYNEAGQPMADTKGTIATATGVTEWTPEIGDLYGVTQDKFKPHAVTKINLKGVKVGDSAQTTALIGATFKPLKGMRIGLDWSVFARNYANYAISNPSMNDTANYKTPWEIPWGNQFDFNISYGFKVGSCRATVYGNINNLFDQEYITDAYDGATHDWDSAYRVFYAFGRTFTVRLKLNF